MDFKERKRLIQNTFDAAAESYDNPSLRLFETSAQYLAGLMELEGNEDLLDVVFGTGAATFALSARLPNGHITGMDFSERSRIRISTGFALSIKRRSRVILESRESFSR